MRQGELGEAAVAEAAREDVPYESGADGGPGRDVAVDIEAVGGDVSCGAFVGEHVASVFSLYGDGLNLGDVEVFDAVFFGFLGVLFFCVLLGEKKGFGEFFGVLCFFFRDFKVFCVFYIIGYFFLVFGIFFNFQKFFAK